MESFIKKIFLWKNDEKVHRQFVRFGKGDYKKRAVISFHKTTAIKLKGSFEYANELVELALEFNNAKFSGIILSKEKLEFENERKKGGIFEYEVNNIESNKIKEISEKAYGLLLDAEGEGISLKIKKKLPKPGKSGEAKVDDKFCQLEASLDKENAIREAFFWDAFGKKIKIEHEYIINEIIAPENEKDFEKIRLNAKRKGRIIRKLAIDAREEVKEVEFEA